MKGARLWYAHPELFFRNCDVCREFVPDDRQPDGIKRGPFGDKLRRPEATVPTDGSTPAFCRACPRFDASRGRPWPGFTPREDRTFQIFRTCDAFGVLPRPGGAEQQEPGSMEVLLMLKQVKDNCQAVAAEERWTRQLEMMLKHGR